MEALTGLSGRDFDSLLLHLYERRTSEMKPVELLRRFEEKRTSRPVRADARRLHRVEGQLFDSASEFEALAPAPVVPLGATRTLGGIHQNNVLSALRGHEVTADPTVWMALEAARRRRARRSSPVNLCCSHRVMRMQPAPAPLLPHFQLFACLTAMRQGSLFEVMRRHAAVYLRVIRARQVVFEVSDPRRVRALLAEHGVQIDRQFRAHDIAASKRYLEERGIALPRGRGLDDRLERELLEPLEAEFPEVEMIVDLGRTEGLAYYTGPVMRITADGHHLVDGGQLDWTARLLCDRAEWCFSSGIGVDRVALEDLSIPD